jgi:hypothetical protein
MSKSETPKEERLKAMYEYTIMNCLSGEKAIIFGRTYARACQKHGINPAEWEVIDYEYAD